MSSHSLTMSTHTSDVNPRSITTTHAMPRLHLCRPFFFCFISPSPSQIYTLSLHDALPISRPEGWPGRHPREGTHDHPDPGGRERSEEHTSELQSPYDLVCRLLLEKKKRVFPKRLCTSFPHKRLQTWPSFIHNSCRSPTT